MVDSLPEATADVDSQMPLDATQPLREHMPFIVVFVLSAMLSALALTYIYSERYRAEATIFFKPSEVTRLVTSSTQAFGSPYPSNTDIKAIDRTISQLVITDPLLRQVVADLHLDVPKPRDMSGAWYVRYYKQAKYALLDFSTDTWQILKWGRFIEDPVAAAVARLRGRVKVAGSDSYTYDLTVLASTPQRAAAIADDLSARLIAALHGVDLRSAEERRHRLAELRDGKAREIESIERELRQLLAGSQVASLSDELAEATRRASHLLKDQADTTADLQQSDGKVAGLAEKLRMPGLQRASVDGDPPGIHGPSRLDAKDYARLTSEKLDAEVRSGALRARLASIERSAAAANARLQLLNQIQARYDLLSAQLKAAKHDYSSLSDAYEEAVIQSTTGQSQLRLEARATAPPTPVSPIKIYHVGAAGALALIIAIGLAYVLDYFDIRLFLPPPGGERRRRSRRLPAAPAPEGAAARVALD